MKRRFKRIYIEITNVCNLSCHFCPETKRGSEVIDIDQFIAILEQIKPYTQHVYLHVKGEPLLHPRLEEILDLCESYGIKVNITTNGTLLPKVRELLLSKRAIRQINFSLHSMAVNLNFMDKETYITRILDFVKEVRSKREVYISLRLWNLEEDNDLNLLKKQNRQILETIEHAFDLDFKIEEMITPGAGVKVMEGVYINQDHVFEWPDLNAKDYGDRGFCYGLRDHVAILVDGTVVPCCLDGEGVINLGNIHEQPFEDIITGERATRIYEGFSERRVVEELCRRCGYRTKLDLKEELKKKVQYN